MFARFSHIALNVADLPRSIHFYEQVLAPLGFKLADSEDKQYARFTNNQDAVVVLSQVEAVHCDRPFHRKAIGLSHLALAVETHDQVDEMARHLEHLGVRLLGQGKVDSDYRRGYHTIAFEDPDRIMIEIVFHDAYYFSILPP
jgi:catechol 2,3-dioxygenase-like lactoylglutathione lyase family enzyme